MCAWRERRVAHWRGAKRIQLRGEMPVAANRFDEVGCRDDDPGVDAGRGRGRGRRGFRRPGLEGLARLWIDRLGILPVALVELENVRGIDSRELPQVHNLLIVTRLVCPSLALTPRCGADLDRVRDTFT